MRATLAMTSLLMFLLSFQAQAGFFDDLGKDLSMLSCKNQQKKSLIESVILNKDPKKPQIWWWKVGKGGKLVENPDPRQWYTIYDKESLKYFCWDARLSFYVSSHHLEMYPAVQTTYVCGHKVYSCMTGSEGGDHDNNDKPGTSNPDGDNGGNPDDNGGSNPDDNGGSNPDDNGGTTGPGDSDDNF